MLRSDLCDFSDAYIVVKGDITASEKVYTDTVFPDNLFSDFTDFPDAAAKAAGRNAERIVARRTAKASAVNAAKAVNANDT